MLRNIFGQLAIAAGLILSCGSDQQPIVKSFSYDIQDNVVTMALEFSQDIELNTEFIIPILDYGSVILTPPADGKGFIIGGSLNLDYIADGRLGTLSKTRRLPNNQPMTTYVTQDLARLRTKQTDQIYTNVYLGADSEHMYLGTALELGYLDQHFPAGLVISGRISDQQKRTVGVITIFGPEVKDGEMVNPGGIFFVTNISDLIKYHPSGLNKMRPESIQDLSSFKRLVEINDLYSREYSNPFKLNKLLQQMRQAGIDAGYVDQK